MVYASRPIAAASVEYLRIAENVAPCKLMLTNFRDALPDSWTAKARRNIITESRSIKDLGLDKSSICLMDSESPDLLAPEDSTKFSYFLLGGILGNVDEFDFDRTSLLRAEGFPTRNLGSMQMSTDTAAICTKLVVIDQVGFETIDFVDRPEIRVDDCEHVVMNFRYIKGPDGEPLMAKGVLDLIKQVDFDTAIME